NTISLTNLPPGQGELFRIVDKTYEYIPNVNVTAVQADTTWYGHDRGVVMVARGSGNRAYYHDATYTPAVDLGVSNTHVFVALDNGTTGKVVRMSRDLGTVDVSNFYTGNPRVRAVTVSADESRAMVVDRLSTTTSNVKIWDAGTWQAPIPFNDAGAPTTPYV